MILEYGYNPRMENWFYNSEEQNSKNNSKVMIPKLKIDFRILKKENWKSILDSEEWKLKKDSKVISQELIIYPPNSQLGGGGFFLYLKEKKVFRWSIWTS